MINRREALIRLGGLAALGLTAPTKALADTIGTESKAAADGTIARGKPFAVGHITDVHLISKYEAEKWTAKAFHELQSHPAKPTLILNTGDSVMDTCKTDRQEADAQWKTWQNTVKNEVGLPMFSCLGNHDIWGIHHAPDAKSRKDPSFGRKLGLDGLGMEKLYYSFDKGDWHFVMLDSIMTGKEMPWFGMLDDEQFHWLEADLKATPKDRNVLVSSHMPILQMCMMLTMTPDDKGTYNFNSKNMMADARRIVDLFKKHPNVKLCFSGHIHRLDKVEVSGVTYICDGAMSGDKWHGNTANAKPGYSVTTLNPDGTFDYEYKTFGWKKA